MKTPLHILILTLLFCAAASPLTQADITSRPGPRSSPSPRPSPSSPRPSSGAITARPVTPPSTTLRPSTTPRVLSPRLHTHSGLRYSPGLPVTRPNYGGYYGHRYYGHRFYGPHLGFGSAFYFGGPYDYGYYPGYYGSPYYYDYDYVQPFPLEPSAPSSQAAAVYNGMGRDWGQDLRRDVVTWERFQIMLRTVILPASQLDQQAFRRGFTEAYGTNGDAAFEKAWKEMQGVSTDTAAGNTNPALPPTPPSNADTNNPAGLPPAVETK